MLLVHLPLQFNGAQMAIGQPLMIAATVETLLADVRCFAIHAKTLRGGAAMKTTKTESAMNASESRRMGILDRIAIGLFVLSTSLCLGQHPAETGPIRPTFSQSDFGRYVLPDMAQVYPAQNEHGATEDFDFQCDCVHDADCDYDCDYDYDCDCDYDCGSD
jgi:hypothetical protein